jgi:hypothetical protein
MNAISFAGLPTLLERINIAHSSNAAWAEGKPMSTRPTMIGSKRKFDAAVIPAFFRKRRWACLFVS